MADPVQEGGKVASGIVEALRTQPLTLALIVVTAVFMYFVASAVREQRASSHEIIKLLLDKCGPSKTSAAIALPIAFHLIKLTGPDNQEIEVNPDEVVMLREKRELEHHFHKNISCLVFTTDGKFVGVLETCDEVRVMLEKAANEGSKSK
jgi:hypothetical protein